MDSLEKLFVSCLVLFGLFILFLFGLYFDLGDIVAGMLHRDEKGATGVGLTDELIRQMEWKARPREVMPTHLIDSADLQNFSGADDASMEYSVMHAYCGLPRAMTGREKVQVRRKQLVQQGFTREEFLEMESLGEDRDEFQRTIIEVDQLAAGKHYAEAAKLLGTTIEQANPKNLLLLRDGLRYQMQLFLDAKQFDRAKETSRRLYDVLDRILTIKGVAYPEDQRQGLDKTLAELKAEKARLDEIYQDFQKRTAETGSPTGITADEKAQMKEALTKARQEGKITDEEYKRTVKELES